MKRKLTFTQADFADGARAPEAGQKPATKPATGNDPVFTAWRSGTGLRALVVQYGGSRSSMRKRLTAAAGGKDAFRALRQQGAGGTAVPFGGQRAQPRTREVRAQDDRLVPRIRSTDITHCAAEATVVYARTQIPILKARLAKADDPRERTTCRTDLMNMRAVRAAAPTGWSSQLTPGTLGSTIRLTDTDGQHYVKARGNEQADVIVELADDTLQPARYRREAHASTSKAARKAAALLARGQAAYAVTRTHQRAARTARTARRHK